MANESPMSLSRKSKQLFWAACILACSIFFFVSPSFAAISIKYNLPVYYGSSGSDDTYVGDSKVSYSIAYIIEASDRSVDNLITTVSDGIWASKLTISAQASGPNCTHSITVKATFDSGGIQWTETILSETTIDGSLAQSFDVAANCVKLEVIVYCDTESNYWIKRSEVLMTAGYTGNYRISGSTSTPKVLQKALQGTPGDNVQTLYTGGKRGDGLATCSLVGLPGYHVNTSTLNLVISDTEYASSGLGPDLSMTRTWNSSAGDDAGSGMFGKGWSFAYVAQVTSDGTSDGPATLLRNGQQLEFPPKTESTDGGTTTTEFYPPVTGMLDTLQGVFPEDVKNSYYLLTRYADKHVWRFNHASSSGDTHTYALASITDRNCNAVDFTYNADGTLQSITDAAGRATTFAYDGFKRCRSMTAPTGAAASYAYDANGRLQQTIDFMDYVSSFAYDADGRITSMTTEGKTTSFAYTEIDGITLLASATNALGKTTTYNRDSDTKVTITSPEGIVSEYANVNGKTRNHRPALGMSPYTNIEYNDEGLPETVTHYREAGDNSEEKFEYDTRGNVTKYTDLYGGEATYTYDSGDNLLTSTDPLGNTTTYTYDANGNLATSVTPLGKTTTYTCDDKGLLTSVINSDSSTNTYSYDNKGNLVSATDTGGNSWTYGYDTQGSHMTSSTTPLGNKTTYTYDANQRLTKETRADDSTNAYTYSCCALTSFANAAGNTWTISRDALLNPLTKTDPLGRTVSMVYDDDQRLTSFITPLGRTLSFDYFEDGLVKKNTYPDGGIVSYTYDHPQGTRTSITDQKDSPGTSTFTYDELGKVLTLYDGGSTTISYTYDELARMSTMTNARGQVVAMVYDADGRLTGISHDGTSAATFSWNDRNRLISYADATGTTTYTRNSLGATTNIAYPSGKDVDMGYDADGNLTSITYPGALAVSYTYDVRGRPTKVSFDGNSVDIAYDSADNLASFTRSNGVTTTFTYDAAGQLTAVKHASDSATLAELAYTYDTDGRIIKETVDASLAPDADSSIINATYGTTNRFTNWGGKTLSYDDDGNLLTLGDSRNLSLSYDLLNRPTSMTIDGVTSTFTYDAIGNRVKIEQDGETRVLHFDQWMRPLFETNADGNLVAVNILIGGLLMARSDGDGNFVFPLYDNTGNCLALTNEAGAVITAFAYTPQGLKTAVGTDTSFPYTYVGGLGVMDDGSGIYFMRNRSYDAVTGRFLQRDPLCYVDGPNLYLYASNNPVSLVDPQGTVAAEAAIIASVPTVAVGVSTGLTIYAAGDGVYTMGVQVAAGANIQQRKSQLDDLSKFAERRAVKNLASLNRLNEMMKNEKCPSVKAKLLKRALYHEQRAKKFQKMKNDRDFDYMHTVLDSMGNRLETGNVAVSTTSGFVQSTAIGGIGPGVGLGKGETAAMDIINSTVVPNL